MPIDLLSVKERKQAGTSRSTNTRLDPRLRISQNIMFKEFSKQIEKEKSTS